MKILIQIPQLIFGGAEKVLVSFANDLVSRGHEVEVLETYEKGFLKDQFDSRVNFSAICSDAYTKKYYASPAQIKKNPLLLGKWLFSKLVGYRRYAEKLAAKHYADKHYDVAINYLEIDSPAFLLDHIHANKYLQWIHIDVDNLENAQSLQVFAPDWARMDSIICVSQIAVDSFRRQYPDLSGKVSLLYNFYDTKEILRKGSTPYTFDGLRPAILSVGRMTEQKKYLRFLDVLAKLRNEGFDFSWHILGEGAQRPEIEEKIASLGLSDRVYLHGVSDNPYKYMKNCDLFALPSGWEGFPTVTVEAKLLGCAVLATDVSGIREQLIHGESGWIVDNSEAAIYRGLKELLSKPDILATLHEGKALPEVCQNDTKYQAFLNLLEN